MWEGKPWDPWQDMVLGGILGGALRPALSNLPSPSLGGSGSGNPSANAGTIGVPTVTGADTSGGTSTGPAGGNAPSTQSNAPQPGVGSGGGGSQPAGGNGVNVPDNSAPQPGVGNGGSSQPAGGGAPPIDNSAPQPGAGDGGGSQPAPSNAPEVPSGDVPSPAGDAPAAPPADAPAVPPADAPAVPPADAPAAPPADAPTAPPADAPAAPPADAPAAPPADALTPDTSSTDATAPDAPVTEGSTAEVATTETPTSDAPASDAPPADGIASDAFGIPVVDLPSLPDALPSSTATSAESLSSTGNPISDGPTTQLSDLDAAGAEAADVDAPEPDSETTPVSAQSIADGDGADSGATPNPLDDILVGGAEPGASLTPEQRQRLADQGYHLALFDRIQHSDYYDRPDPTLGREGSPFWSMPLEDGAHVASAADAARATGMSPATLRAMTGYEVNPVTGNPMYDPENPDFFRVPDADRQIFGAIFRPDASNPPIKPVEADAGGWAHFSEYPHDLGAGRTAVRTSVSSSGGYLVNTDVREYVTVGGRALRSGDLIISIDGDGDWVIERVF